MNRQVRQAVCLLGMAGIIAQGGGVGCALLKSKPPPPQGLLLHHDDCNVRRGPVVVDVLGAVASGGFAALNLGAAALVHDRARNEVVPTWNADYDAGDPEVAFLVTGLASLAVGAIFTYSASYGAKSRRDCAEARRLLPGPIPPARM